MQLKLVEAAHILPVQATDSPDDVRNGIALSPTYHRAFDRGLVFLDTNHRMQLNPKREAELSGLGLSAGMGSFRMPLGKRIHLPIDTRLRPALAMIRKANRYRRI